MFVVTGGGSGIGRALAKALAARGRSVLIIGRREACLADVAATSVNIDYLCADVACAKGRETIVTYLQAYPHLEGFVHNAGVIDPIVPMAELEEEAWRAVMATNLDAPFFLTKALNDQLIGGRVLHVGSGAAYFPVVGWAPYCVSKAGLAMLTRCWQLENPSIAFASVMPGIIDTDMQTSIRASHHMTQEKHAFFQDLKESGQLLTVERVAAFLVCLLLDVDAVTYVSKEWDIYDPLHEAMIYA